MRDFKAGDKVRLKRDVPLRKLKEDHIPDSEILAVRNSDYVVVERNTKNHLVKISPLVESVGFYWDKEWFEYYSVLPEELFEI